jgi:hypothetical protein
MSNLMPCQEQHVAHELQLSKPGLRYEEEIGMILFENKSEICFKSWKD